MSLCRIVLSFLILSSLSVQTAEAQPGGATVNRDRSTKATSSPHFTWITQYDQALEEARRTGKPLLLTFRCVP